ncbi:MAG: amidophosphoribosyltransferase [Clostridia bacterium]|nr:amidophosphoribosyltransferase [Clostridia bacterium]MDE7329457.1 amidophosphoribosyltransferase [Clostridia bacterium]
MTNLSDVIKEECGIFGIYDKSKLGNIANQVYFGLFALQHRGQEAAGIAVNCDREITLVKNLGLVSEVFNDSNLAHLQGEIAIGHVRYSTTGNNTAENAQPISVKYAKGNLTVSHNGNITNAKELREKLEAKGAIFHTTSDSEVISYLIANQRLKSASIEEAVEKVFPMLQGAFSLLIMSPRKLIAVRDKYGIRPLCMGKLQDNVIFASESCSFETIGATFVRDVRPGEMVIVTEDNIVSNTKYCGNKGALCIFEHIYTARPDSVIDNQSVNEARMNAGKMLAKKAPVDADVVIGVPDSGLPAAIGYSHASGIPYGVGLIKNRYIGRTFIQPTQAMRERSVALKLNTLKSNVEGKRIVMVDDSIVRGTTLANIVKLLKKSGAKEVHIRISSPPFIYPCFFGTDIPSRKDLACNNYTLEELRIKIGADSLAFLDKETIDKIAPDSSVSFCKACFTGKYPCKVPGEKTDKNIFEQN